MSEEGIFELGMNLSDAEAAPLLPQGDYEAEITNVEKRMSDKGNSYFSLQFRIDPTVMPPDIDADTHYPEGARLSYNRIMCPDGTQRTLYRLKKFIEALGLPTNTSTIDIAEWMNRTAKVRIKHSTWEGEERMEIAGVHALD